MKSSMKITHLVTLVILVLSLTSHYTGVESLPLASHTSQQQIWHSSHSPGGADERLVSAQSTGSSVSAAESSLAAHSLSRRHAADDSLPFEALRTRRTPTDASWPVAAATNAQAVDLQQVNHSPRSLPLESHNEAHLQETSDLQTKSGPGNSVHFGRIMGDDDVDSLSIAEGHNSLFDLSSLDSDTVMNMLNLIKNDPDTFNELIGVKSGSGESGVSSSSNGKSRNSRNRVAYEADVLQKVLQVYQDKVAPKLLLVKRGEGPQLSVVSPLDVLRQQLLYELARRRSKELQEKIQVNEQLLKSLGKRSVDPNDGPDDSPQ